MVFAYYHRLSSGQKRVYRQSDQITSLPLPQATTLHPLVAALAAGLEAQDQRRIQHICQQLSDAITTRLRVAPVRVELLAVRPTDDWGELHGLYDPASGHKRSVVQLWMRTAHHKRIVAFKTFLRTLLHELCHHLDYELLQLSDSFHTEGFYKRLSSLFHQLMRTGDALAGSASLAD
ncbi:MAG: hypothetical protein ACE5LB_11605 [Acidiferrobacterales bacterium]